MKQSIELMRRRHAYYTRLISDSDIHTAQEFYDRFHEQFMLTGTQLWMKNGACDIHIECEDYDYEDYTIVDGKSNGLASVSPVVAFKTVCTNVDANIFEINHIDEGFFCGEHNMEYIHKAIADKREKDIKKRQLFIDDLLASGASFPKNLVETILNAQRIWQYRYQSRSTDIIGRIDYLTDLLLNRDYYPNAKTFLKDSDEVICIIYTSPQNPLAPEEYSRISRLYTAYFGDMNVKWHVIKAVNTDLDAEIELKQLYISTQYPIVYDESDKQSMGNGE